MIFQDEIENKNNYSGDVGTDNVSDIYKELCEEEPVVSPATKASPNRVKQLTGEKKRDAGENRRKLKKYR